MSALIQFIVLKREGRSLVKSMDSERFFPIHRQAINAAIRFANARGGAIAKIENQIREDLDIRREHLSAR
jgi:hypothetical protein